MCVLNTRFRIYEKKVPKFIKLHNNTQFRNNAMNKLNLTL